MRQTLTVLVASLAAVSAYSLPQVPRRRAVLLAAGATVASSLPSQAADTNPFAPPKREGLQARWLEQLRVVLQDEADATQYGGELAPGGPPAGVPGLQLVPIAQMRATLMKMEPSFQHH